MTPPFTGVEPYYARLFQQIKGRHHPLGTGGDQDCLIAMLEWLWARHPLGLAVDEEQSQVLSSRRGIRLKEGDA